MKLWELKEKLNTLPGHDDLDVCIFNDYYEDKWDGLKDLDKVYRTVEGGSTYIKLEFAL